MLYHKSCSLPSFSQSRDDLQNKDTASNTTTTNLATLRSPDTNIIVGSKELGLNTSSPSLLCRHTKVQDVTGVVHGKNKDTLLIVDTIHSTLADLLSRWRGEDGTSNRGIEQSLSNQASKGRFVARATTRDNGDLGVRGRGIRTTVDDFVLGVKAETRVGDSEGVKGGLDEMGRVREEVFC